MMDNIISRRTRTSQYILIFFKRNSMWKRRWGKCSFLVSQNNKLADTFFSCSFNFSSSRSHSSSTFSEATSTQEHQCLLQQANPFLLIHRKMLASGHCSHSTRFHQFATITTCCQTTTGGRKHTVNFSLALLFFFHSKTSYAVFADVLHGKCKSWPPFSPIPGIQNDVIF